MTSTREEATKKLYHTLVHSHLPRLARILQLHSDGSAWVVVHVHLTCEIPHGPGSRSAGSDDAVRSMPGRYLMNMYWEVTSSFGLLRKSHIPSCFLSDVCNPQLVREPFPNLIHYRPEEMKGR